MSRKTLRSLFAGLAFALILLPAAAPGEAAGMPDREPGSALTASVQNWVVGLWDRISDLIGANPAPNPGGQPQAPTADGDIGSQTDPNG